MPFHRLKNRLAKMRDGMKRLSRGIAVRILVVLLGDFVGAVAMNNFLVPAHILAGGATGLAQVVQHYLHISIGIMFFILNVPLFVIAYKNLGRRFVMLTGVAILGFSVLVDYVHLPIPYVQDTLLMSVYGGVLSGASVGILIRAGGSSGGTDILSLVISRRFGQSVANLSFIMNGIIVLLSMVVFGVEDGMYTLVSMFAASRVVQTLLNFQQRRTALIVSAKATDISKVIAHKLGRGSTLVSGAGTYTNASRGVLICVLTHLEITELKTMAKHIDPQVFIAILDTSEVAGRFRTPSM